MNISERLTRIERAAGSEDPKLPEGEHIHLLDGPKEVREKRQEEITKELTLKYGAYAAEKAVFVHFVTTQEIMEGDHEQAER